MLNKLRRALAKLIVTRNRKTRRVSTTRLPVLKNLFLSSSSPLLPLSYLQLYSLDDFICFFFDTHPASTSLVPPFSHISLHRPPFESYSLLPSSSHLFITTKRVTMFVYKRGKSFLSTTIHSRVLTDSQTDARSVSSSTRSQPVSRGCVTALTPTMSTLLPSP